MAERKLTQVVLDTSYLRAVGFSDPDFRKLLEHAKAKRLQVLVPHIAWEELRTHLLEQRLKLMRELRAAHERLVKKVTGDLLLDGLESPALVLWRDEEAENHSKKAMQAFAAGNGIEVIRIRPDHAERAWDRFFGVKPPFDSAKGREERRKDIPDSWILETAIDLKAQYPNLRAFCCDVALSTALNASGIEADYASPDKAREMTRAFLEKLEAELAPPPPQELPAAPLPEAPPAKEADLDAVLDQAQGEFKNVEIKVLGFVTYLETPTKDELFALMEKSGVPADVARNAAERLALAKLVVDTGNYYLPENKEAGEQAAALVEPEIIRLLKGER